MGGPNEVVRGAMRTNSESRNKKLCCVRGVNPRTDCEHDYGWLASTGLAYWLLRQVVAPLVVVMRNTFLKVAVVVSTTLF